MRELTIHYVDDSRVQTAKYWPLIILAISIILAITFRPQHYEAQVQPMPIMKPSVQVETASIPFEAPQQTTQEVERIIECENVRTFVASYPDSQLDGAYLDILEAEANDCQLLAQIVAIATAETGQGKTSPLSNNFWGWFLNGDREYNPDRITMSHDIATGIKEYYSAIDSDIATIYTGGDRTSNWYSIYTWAMSEMPINQ